LYVFPSSLVSENSAVGEKLSGLYASPLGSHPKLECIVETVLQQGDNEIYRVYEYDREELSKAGAGINEIPSDSNEMYWWRDFQLQLGSAI
jgi:hypothetical protein